MVERRVRMRGSVIGNVRPVRISGGWHGALGALLAAIGLVIFSPVAASAAATPWAIVQGAAVPPAAALESDACDAASRCVAVGFDDQSGGTAEPLIEAGNHGRWTVQSPPAGFRGSLYGVSCTTERYCVAVGTKHASKSVSNFLPVIAARNGNGPWVAQIVPVPAGMVGATLLAVSCTAANACTAVGAAQANNSGTMQVALGETWNGTTWQARVTPFPKSAAQGRLDGVSCVSPVSCVAVGDYSLAPEEYHSVAEAWDGTSWKVQVTPTFTRQFSQLYSVSCSSPGTCTAVGWRPGGAAGSVLVERLSAGRWLVQQTPVLTGGVDALGLNGVSCTSATSCTSTGASRERTGTRDDQTLAEHWDGKTWTVEPSPSLSSTPSSFLFAVSCTSATTCTSVGFGGSYSSPVTLIEAEHG